jgi:hypothetical protein
MTAPDPQWAPPGGFRWAEPTPRRRRWPVIVAVLAVIVLAAGVGVWVWHPWRGSGRAQAAHPAAPREVLLGSMRAQPVPGWQRSTGQIGLPAGTATGMFIGAVGDRGYYVTSQGTDGGSYVYGVDATGTVVLAPVSLDGRMDSFCYLNGPTRIICFANDLRIPKGDPVTAWVVDTSAGRLLYHGPSMLRSGPQPNGEFLTLTKRAGYLLLEKDNIGIYGIGDQAQPTWFVPGKGGIGVGDEIDTPPSTLATQQTAQLTDVVFSVADGSRVTPEVSSGSDRLYTAMTFPGGFGYEFAGSDPNDRGLLFFDEHGHQLGRVLIPQQPQEFFDFAQMPIGYTETQWFVYRPDGTLRLQFNQSGAGVSMWVSGSTLLFDRDYTTTDGPHPWQQYDLDTGQARPPCTIDQTGYLGTDGQVMVSGFPESLPAGAQNGIAGVDMTSCTTLWTLVNYGVNRIGDTLVGSDPTGMTLMSLVPPR